MSKKPETTPKRSTVIRLSLDGYKPIGETKFGLVADERCRNALHALKANAKFRRRVPGKLTMAAIVRRIIKDNHEKLFWKAAYWEIEVSQMLELIAQRWEESFSRSLRMMISHAHEKYIGAPAEGQSIDTVSWDEDVRSAYQDAYSKTYRMRQKRIRALAKYLGMDPIEEQHLLGLVREHIRREAREAGARAADAVRASKK